MMTTPRIYVADLAEYTAGNLVGKWIDVDELTDADMLHEIIVHDVLRAGNEEWAIHDYEGFGPIRIGEYDSMETIAGHVERMGDEPNKYFAWIASRGDAENYDPDEVFGPYESESDYFDQYLDNCYGSMDLEEVLINSGVDKRTAGHLAQLLSWVDAEQFVRDGGNPLVEVSTGDYSREYYEVSQ